MDVLADLLSRSHARGAAFAHSTASGRWGFAFEPVPGLAIHMVVAGEVWLRAEAHEPRRLTSGDVLLVRGDVRHALSATADAPLSPLQELLDTAGVPGSSRRYEVVRPGPAPESRFFCGAYLFEGDLCTTLVAALPEVLVVHAAPATPLRAALDLLAGEMQRDRPGQQTILDRLLDVALVHLLREHFADEDVAAPRWFRAQDDPEIGRVLALLHGDPGAAWTVAGLGDAVGLSRAALARRFTQLVGVPPLQYLTDWRMALARERLRDTGDTLGQIAADVGYSEYAFAAAFKREHGIAPGRWRTDARAARTVAA